MHEPGGGDILLRPSFYALNQIEDLDDVIDRVVLCLALVENGHNPAPVDLCRCASVLHACGLPQDRMDLVGEVVPSRTGKPLWKQGKMPIHNLVVLANALISAGIIGDKTRARKAKAASREKFDPALFVAAAAAHLGVPLDQAWHMTMTEFQLLMDAKHPPKKPAMTHDDVRAAFQRNGIPLQSKAR